MLASSHSGLLSASPKSNRNRFGSSFEIRLLVSEVCLQCVSRIFRFALDSLRWIDTTAVTLKIAEDWA